MAFYTEVRSFLINQIFGHEKGLGDLFLRGLCYDSRGSAIRVGEGRNPCTMWL